MTEILKCGSGELVEEHGWINADERQPDTDDDMLCWFEYFRYGDYNRMFRTYGIGNYFNGRWMGDVAYGTKCKVLYWQPLPKPPKED